MPTRDRTKKILTFEEKILILEELATELLETARQLRPGTERHGILREIRSFRVRIAALRKSEPSLRENFDKKAKEIYKSSFVGTAMRMVRRVATVEVTSPDGIKSLWVVALPHGEAVTAVRMVIPPDHIAELSICRLPGSQKKLYGVRPGEVRKIETMTHSKSPSDPR